MEILSLHIGYHIKRNISTVCASVCFMHVHQNNKNHNSKHGNQTHVTEDGLATSGSVADINCVNDYLIAVIFKKNNIV